MEIEVMKFRLMKGDHPVRAYVSIRAGDWIVHEWRIIQRPGYRAVVQVPITSWKDHDGRVQYRALLSMPADLQQQIEVAILSAWAKEKQNAEKQVQ